MRNSTICCIHLFHSSIGNSMGFVETSNYKTNTYKNTSYINQIYLPRILDTHPLETWRILEISQGRAPEWASSTIFCLVESGRGRPLTNTPPSWFTPLWPVHSHIIRVIIGIKVWFRWFSLGKLSHIFIYHWYISRSRKHICYIMKNAKKPIYMSKGFLLTIVMGLGLSSVYTLGLLFTMLFFSGFNLYLLL